MLPKIPTHRRRQIQILRWIDRQGDRARVIWRREGLGTWHEIGAHCVELRSRLYVRFKHLGRRVECRIMSLHVFAEGVRLSLAGGRGSDYDEMHVLLGEFRRPPAPRQQLLGVAQAWLGKQVPGAPVLCALRRSELRDTLSGSLLRVHARHFGRDHLLLVAPSDQGGDRAGEILTQGLIWAAALRRERQLPSAPRIILLVPTERSAEACHRARFLNRSRCSVELWEYDPAESSEDAQPAPPPSPPLEHRDFRWPVLGPFRWSEPLARVLDLAPEEIRRYPRFQEYDSLRLRGLEFARVEGLDRNRVTFGVGSARTELAGNNFEALAALVAEILYFRRPDSPDTRHAFYRMQSERWMESLILDRCAYLFPEMAPGSVYSQIPVYLGDRQGRVDILGADRDGRLVVMELKVCEDVGLPLQALDYWGRVVEHNLMGDFEKRGYFSEVRLNRDRPRIYLVSPVFSFHDTTESILDFVDPEIEVWKIAVNVDWRCGVKILGRRCVNGGRGQ